MLGLFLHLKKWILSNRNKRHFRILRETRNGHVAYYRVSTVKDFLMRYIAVFIHFEIKFFWRDLSAQKIRCLYIRKSWPNFLWFKQPPGTKFEHGLIFFLFLIKPDTWLSFTFNFADHKWLNLLTSYYMFNFRAKFSLAL